MTGITLTPLVMAAVVATGGAQAVPRSADAAPSVLMNSLYGPTGLINVPTSFAAPRDTVGFGAGFAKDFRGPSANWGVVDSIEIGGAFLDRAGTDNKAIANAKVHIIPSNFSWFDVGVGVIDAMDAVNQTFYVVGSAAVNPPSSAPGNAFAMRIHGGVGTGVFGEKLFGGGELFLSNNTTVVGEWDTRNFNTSLRYRHNDEFAVQAGVANKGLFLSSTYTLRF